MNFHNGQILKFLAVIFFLGVAFSQDYDYPMYSEANLPETKFTCSDKIHGGYYADIETGCQMYHICARDKFGYMRSQKFLCGNGTVFDQRHMVCQDYRKVRSCKDSPKYYRNNAKLLELLEERLRSEKRDEEILKAAEFDSDYDYPMYSNINLPQTSFSCKDKVNGAYYADIETNCQMYHVCSKDRFGYLRSTRFLCGNGTVFDQRHLVCQDYKGIRCKDSEKYFKHPTAWRFWPIG